MLALRVLLTALPIATGTPDPGVGEGRQTSRYELVPAETRVWFEANATMGRFRGRAERVRGWAEVTDTATLAMSRGEVTVDASSFGTGIAMRNQHLRKELETERYPTIRFVLDRVEPSNATATAGRAVTLHGQLTIKGATRDVRVPASLVGSDGTLTLEGQLPAKFSEYGMRPPTRLGGMTRVRDDLLLRFHAVFRRSEGSSDTRTDRRYQMLALTGDDPSQLGLD